MNTENKGIKIQNEKNCVCEVVYINREHLVLNYHRCFLFQAQMALPRANHPTLPAESSSAIQDENFSCTCIRYSRVLSSAHAHIKFAYTCPGEWDESIKMKFFSGTLFFFSTTVATETAPCQPVYIARLLHLAMVHKYRATVPF